MKKLILAGLVIIYTNAISANIIPMGNENNMLYYKLGGSSDFVLPPVANTESVVLNASSDLGLGYSCSAFNPALSMINSINNMRDDAENLTKTLINNATGSLIQLPLYEIARSNPVLYALLNNKLLNINKRLDASVKSCQATKDQIAHGENPYRDWATLAINEQWKQNLSLVSAGSEDINHAKDVIDHSNGSGGVPWVTGIKDNNGVMYAGGKNGQPPVHVIADTIKAGYNTLLNRNLQSDEEAPQSEQLSYYFPTPLSAMTWITSVVGDQTITTCNDDNCLKKQGSIVGLGLLPSVNSCNKDKENCIETIRQHITNLVFARETITKENLERVSAEGIAISPDVISSIKMMDTIQQTLLINKLSQEIAAQRVINKALIARNILATGAQVPVIAANHPAQILIGRAITNLDNHIRSILFENQIRKQMLTDTLSQTINYSKQQQQHVMQVPSVLASDPLIEDSAMLPAIGERK